MPIDELLRWYRANRRDLPWRSTRDIYKTWLSEVMLQQTQVTTAIPYYHRFLERFPTIEALAKADQDEVLKLWEGLGYYGRCRNLHRAAKLVVSRFQGQVPRTPQEFASLPGVGPYIQAAVLSIVENLPLPAVDGNVIRVYCRFKGIEEDIRKTAVKSRITRELKSIIPHESPGDFNQALMELGALVCTPKAPACGACPLSRRCAAKKTSRVGNIPFKSAKKKVPTYRVSIGVILKGDKFYIQKRPAYGHLGGMWEFPGGKAKEGETPDQALLRECREELTGEIFIVEKLARVQHAYTHFRIDMHVFLCRPGTQDIRPLHGQPFRWIGIDQLDEFAFPGANHKFFPTLKQFLTDQE